MMDVALATEGPDGNYREIEAAGYERALVHPTIGTARFPTAAEYWGAVRAWRPVTPDPESAWRILAQPRIVATGEVATLDVLGGILYVEPAPIQAETSATEAPPLPALEGRWRR